MGSTDDARRAGMKHASMEALISTKITPTRMRGSREPPSIQVAITLLRINVSRTPAALPLPTLHITDPKTSRNTSRRCAPSAIRIPNSGVLCATL